MKFALTTTLVLTLSFVFVMGCGQPSDDADSAIAVTIEGGPPEFDDLDAHPVHGPHGGELVELGNEQYHAEWVGDDAGITVYVLDGVAIEPVTIDAPSITVSLKHKGKVSSFELEANPLPDEEIGKVSRFTSAEPPLAEWMDSGAEGNLSLTINGKSFTGNIIHHHDHAHDDAHAGHDHD
ncbi:hypothetical protein [Novipirellula artificiosorum]|uniref:Uncharacterized protein n=1 Tax=Novipirellula artificiosorum TaxID=2528016 RepID=A0A5C6DER2_9BACT|nr:hypothetical protein [Novipirellula artificiosorum]TWU34424.1 hypothetical protein Poly41_45720 [Novipirellula artificiosorum]